MEYSIEEDVEILNNLIDYYNDEEYDGYEELSYTEIKAMENILGDRERLEREKEIQEDNYQRLSEGVSSISKELELEEDATIDEIITKIRILKSKRINMFEQLDCIDKANKYDSLVNKIQDRIKLVDKCYEGLLTDIGGIKIINVSGLSKKEKEEVINKRNCLLVQKATFEEVLQELEMDKV